MRSHFKNKKKYKINVRSLYSFFYIYMGMRDSIVDSLSEKSRCCELIQMTLAGVCMVRTYYKI